MIRIALGALILFAVVMVVRNLFTTVRDTEIRREKAWDAPILEHGVAILAAPPRAWAWWGGLAFCAALANLTLIDSWLAGDGLRETWLHVLLTAGLCAVAVRRGLQLTQKITLTADTISLSGFWGRGWSFPLSALQGVGETRKTAILDFGEGKTLEVPDWLEGRFWLARALRRDVLNAKPGHEG